MKRITLLFCLLAASFGYAQTDVIENFDGDAPTIVAETGPCAPGTYTVVTTQSASAPNSLEIITTAAGSPWQGTELVFQGGESLDLTTNKTIFVDVFSEVPAGILAKVTAGGDSGTSGANHTGSGWETLTFNLDDESDGAGIANGIYTNLIFYPLWGTEGGYSGQDGAAECVTPNPITIYVDNIIGTSGAGAETCSDGILNNGEEEIDCGGPNCAPCAVVPTEAAPTPPPSNAAGVRSIFSDAYTDIADVDWNPEFASSLVSDLVANDDNIKQADFPGFIAGDFVANRFDATDMTMFHIDFWSNDVDLDGKVFNIKLSNWGPTSGGELNALQYDINSTTTPPIASGQWVSVDVPLSAFLGVPQPGEDPNGRDGIAQFLVTSNMGVTYFDNVYLYNSALSTDQFDLSRVSVAPNPTNSVWNVKVNNQNITSISVFDILGKQVITLAPNSSEASIDASALKDGIYLAKITSVNGTRTIKLVKN